MKKKLVLSFGAIIFCMAAIGAYSFYSLNAMERGMTIVAREYLPGLNIINAIKANMDVVRKREYQHAVTGDPGLLRNIEDDIAKAKAAIARSMKEYEGLSRAASATEDLGKLLAIQDKWKAYETVNAKTMALSRSGKKLEAIALENGEGQLAFDHARHAIARLIDDKKEDAAAFGVKNDKAFALAKQRLVILIALAMLISAFAAAQILRVLGNQSPISRIPPAGLPKDN